MRVLSLTTRLSISGPAMQAAFINAALRDMGHETILVAGENHNQQDSIQPLCDRYQLQTHIVPELKRSLNPITQWRSIRALRDFMRDYAPDVVHTHTTTAGFAGRLAARLADVPVVVHTLHTHPFRGLYSRFDSMMFIWLERFGTYFSDSIITLSASLRADLSGRYHIARKNRLTVLPLGYDLQPFTQVKRHHGAFRRAWNIPDDAPLIGIVGRLIDVKHHDLFLNAAAQFHAESPRAHFVIVGDGILRSSLEQLARDLGIGQAVHFIGWQQDMPDIYADMDCIAITSLNEGTPVPLIEGMVVGVPVVATDVGGVRDLLGGGEFGRIVPPDDVPALVDAFRACLESDHDPEPARTAMLNRYSHNHLASDLDALYRGLLTKRQNR